MVRSPLAKVTHESKAQEDKSLNEKSGNQKSHRPSQGVKSLSIVSESQENQNDHSLPKFNLSDADSTKSMNHGEVIATKNHMTTNETRQVERPKEINPVNLEKSPFKVQIYQQQVSMYDSRERIYSKVQKISMAGAVLGILLWGYNSEWFQENVVLKLKYYFTGIEYQSSTNQITLPSPKVKKKMSVVKIDQDGEGIATEPSIARLELGNPSIIQNEILKLAIRSKIPSCRQVVEMHLDRRKSKDLNQFLDLGECLMLQKDHEAAMKIYAQLGAGLRLIPEERFKSRVDFEAHTEALYGYVESHILSGNMRAVGQFLSGRCPKWEYSHTCVAKILLYGYQRVPLDSEGQKLLNKIGPLPRSAQSRLFLGGLMLAVQEGKLKLAEQRSKIIRDNIPNRAQHLLRMYVDYWAVQLFHLGKFANLREFLLKIDQELVHSLHGGLSKIRFLKETSGEGDKKKILESYLKSSEVKKVVKNDLELIEILGTQAIRLRSLEEFENFLKILMKENRQKNPLERNQLSTNLLIWLARILIARGDYLGAIRIFSESGMDSESHPLIAHLRGIAYFQQSDQSSAQLQAISELKKAYKQNKSWESLVVLGFALTKTGKKDAVASVIRDLQGVVSSRGQIYWVELLKGEYYLSQGKAEDALKVAKDLEYEKNNYILPRLLQMRALGQLRRIEEIKVQQAKLEELTRKNPYASSFEALASPFGPLAMAKRPID